VTETGSAVILGATRTVSRAAVLETLAPVSPPFETKTVNLAPSSPGAVTGAVVSDAPVASGMRTPFLNHWYDSGAELLATTVNVADWPSLAVASSGWRTMTGGSARTVRPAELLVTDPAAFEILTAKEVPLSEKAAAGMAYVAAVAPGMSVPPRRH
jgi:hypothetical protein